jgi:hypothetical protein
MKVMLLRNCQARHLAENSYDYSLGDLPCKKERVFSVIWT